MPAAAGSRTPSPVRALLTLLALTGCWTAAPASGAAADEDGPRLFAYEDVMNLEFARAPALHPDGDRVVYVRTYADVMTDRLRSQLWIVDVDGSDHQPLTPRELDARAPVWSPDGTRLLFTANTDHGPELHVLWLATGRTGRISELPDTPRGAVWSPDGDWIAYTRFVKAAAPTIASIPKAPEGAQWAQPPVVIDRLRFRADGRGPLDPGATHVFLIPAVGGAERQLTHGAYDHGGPVAFAPDGEALYVTGNRNEDWAEDPVEADLFRVDLADGAITRLTDGDGPEVLVGPSPDGRTLAWTGFEDTQRIYQQSDVWVRPAGGGTARNLTADFDRSVSDARWADDGRGLYFLADDGGMRHLHHVDLSGRVTRLDGDVGGTGLGRPYTSGGYDAGAGGRYVITVSRPDRPADLAVGRRGGSLRTITTLNEEALGPIALAPVEAVTVPSSADGRAIDAWVLTPPDHEPGERHPLILEIHGGPVTAYGPVFTAELQLMAAQGYVVVYANPRGSSSYGDAFANEIHHAYPGEDYDDLMSVVDAMVRRDDVDPERLFVTGGSGGGVLTAWIVGNTDRFAAAVVAKPVINWVSFVLHADSTPYFARYWFPAMPWEDFEHYWSRSPLSLVGRVRTPTMLLTGEEDLRTPISESEQYYTALRLAGVETLLVRVPGSSHGIAGRPSRLMAKVAHVLAWFEDHDPAKAEDPEAAEEP